MSAHVFASGREPGRCARCGCAAAEAVHGGSARCPACQRLADMPTAPCPQCADAGHPERLIRLDELDSIGTMLLLAYLDGRAPGLVDEWFADRETRKARAGA